MEHLPVPDIPKEKFVFRPINQTAVSAESTRPHSGYLQDAFRRFKKNRSSVVALWILILLVAFAIIGPLTSGHHVRDTDATYKNHPPFLRGVADLGIGILDGSVTHESQSETQLRMWQAIGEETGMDPIIRVLDVTTRMEKRRGEDKPVTYYKLKNNKYYERGIVYRTISNEEFQRIQTFQNETGIQVIYPYVEPASIAGIRDNPNIWYRVKDEKGTPAEDETGHLIPAYSSNAAMQGSIPYQSLRIRGDDGTYIYSYAKAGGVHVRLCYYNYYRYLNGTEPNFLMGTNLHGQCLYTALGVGARFSLLFALIVSAINLTIGALFGAIQGYYGGGVDLLLDRVADILGGVPFVVVCTLFQLHLSAEVGVVPSLLFAFVLTGWLSMAALTRKQFYRFKGREFVMASRTLGASDKRLMFRHIFPNAIGTLITSAVLIIPGVIYSETTMTYLGIINIQDIFGSSLGVLLSQGQTAMTAATHAMLYPSIFISLLLISFNLMGNGLRDAFDPSMRGALDGYGS